VVPLDHERTGFTFVAVERSPRDAGNHLAVDRLFTIEDDGNPPADKRDLHRLPFTRRLRGIGDGVDESINTADAVAVGLLAGAVLDLHFITAAEVEAAVAAFRESELGEELEVIERLFGDEVGARVDVRQQSVLNLPAVLCADVSRLPTGEVVAVKSSTASLHAVGRT
jgi:hypothetical protein